ncbi:hypothetical protein AAG906_020802 [Vitis piasezkii]
MDSKLEALEIPLLGDYEWYKRVDEYMLHIGFTRTSGNISEIEIMKLLLQAEFEMKDIGEVYGDLAYAVSLVSRFMGNPGKTHWEALKWILRYLKGTQTTCLIYKAGSRGDNAKYKKISRTYFSASVACGRVSALVQFCFARQSSQSNYSHLRLRGSQSHNYSRLHGTMVVNHLVSFLAFVEGE